MFKRTLISSSRRRKYLSRLLSSKSNSTKDGWVSVDTSGLIYPKGASKESLILPTSMKFPEEKPSKQETKTQGLLRDLQELIKIRGPISVSEYMQHCLGHPVYGYYKKMKKVDSPESSKTPKESDMFGSKGDFVTAPEISHLFGELIGIWCIAMWQRLGSPSQIRIIEIGPGRGTLMKDLLRAVANFPQFCDSLQEGGIRLIDTSPLLRQEQKECLQAETGEVPQSDSSSKPKYRSFVSLNNFKNGVEGKIPIQWYSFFSEVDAVEQLPTLIICQELFDALPIHQFQINEAGRWSERLVDIDPEDDDLNLRFVLTQSQTPASKLLPSHFLAHNSDNESFSKEAVLEISPLGAGLVQDISNCLSRNSGAALIVDYGYGTLPSEIENETAMKISQKSSLRGIQGHSFVDPLECPGEVDLSADVNFDYLKLNAQEAAPNVTVAGPIPQKELLQNLGIEQRVYELLTKTDDEDEQVNIFAGFKRLVSAEEEHEGGMGYSYKALGIFSQGQKDAKEPKDDTFFPGFSS